VVIGHCANPSVCLRNLLSDVPKVQPLCLGLSNGAVLHKSQVRRSFEETEQIPEANRRIGAVSNHDISLPLSAVPDFIKKGGEVIGKIDEFRINCFGHLGDGNLHYNVFPRSAKTRGDHVAQRDEIKRAVHDLTHELGGSVSAEHGIGRLKIDDLERYGDPAKLSAMRAIKAALDPQGIMNPGAVLRDVRPEGLGLAKPA
ncbi:MAG: FAD-linked oxidase C-terminal domain-containing protein, partial [Pseudomonadota bacterium]